MIPPTQWTSLCARVLACFYTRHYGMLRDLRFTRLQRLCAVRPDFVLIQAGRFDYNVIRPLCLSGILRRLMYCVSAVSTASVRPGRGHIGMV